jgi:hypothetical protein
MKVKAEIIIDKKIEVVWDLMGNKFAEVDRWCSNFKTSKPGGKSKFEGLDYSHRDTITERGQTIQELDLFDNQRYKLSYHITKGLPSAAKKAVGNWSLVTDGDDRTIATFEFEMEPKNFLISLLSPIIEKKLGKASTEIASEFKYYLENGTAKSKN